MILESFQIPRWLLNLLVYQAASFAAPNLSRAFLSQSVKLFALLQLLDEYMLLIQTLFTSVTNQSVTTLPLCVPSYISLFLLSLVTPFRLSSFCTPKVYKKIFSSFCTTPFYMLQRIYLNIKHCFELYPHAIQWLSSLLVDWALNGEATGQNAILFRTWETYKALCQQRDMFTQPCYDKSSICSLMGTKTIPWKNKV